MFAYDGCVSRLHQAVVADLAGTAVSLLDQQLFQQLDDGFVDKLAAAGPHEALGRKSSKSAGIQVERA